MSISANEFTSERFGFNEWFDDCLTVGPTKRFLYGLDTRASEDVKDHLRQSLHHEHPLWSIANGVASKFTTITDGWPVPGFFDHGASEIINASNRQIQQYPEPFFLFTNFMEAHLPHRNLRAYDANVPNRWSSSSFDHQEINRGGEEALDAHIEDMKHFRSLYAAAIRYLDKKIVTFIRDVQKATDHNVTFIVTADHGENLGFETDNRLFGHTSSLSEGLLHVPLEIIGTGGTDRQSNKGFVSHLRLPEIIESLIDGTVPDVQQKCVPAELIGGGLFSNRDHDKYWDRAIRAVYDYEPAKKCVWDSIGNVDWYDFDTAVPSEQLPATNEGGIPSYGDSIFDMKLNQYKQRAKDSTAADHSLDSATEDRLEDLGYL